jgi:uncharacterized membrane protein
LLPGERADVSKLVATWGLDPIAVRCGRRQDAKDEEHTKYSKRVESHQRQNIMLMIIATILIVLWLLGLVTSATMGGFIHILLVVAVVMLLVRLIQGRSIL